MEPSYPIVVAIKPDAATSSRQTTLLFLGTRFLVVKAMVKDSGDDGGIYKSGALDISQRSRWPEDEIDRTRSNGKTRTYNSEIPSSKL